MTNRTDSPAAPASALPWLAALHRYAAAHRQLLEASAVSVAATGDRSETVPWPVWDEHDDAFAALPWPRTLIAWRIERRIARETDYRNRVTQ